MTTTYATAYTRTHTAAFASDKMRTLLKILVQYHGLDPITLVDAWSNWVDRAARRWLKSGHLTSIVIEFYKPGSSTASARWDFPIRYDGNGVDEMWVDRQFLQELAGEVNGASRWLHLPHSSLPPAGSAGRAWHCGCGIPFAQWPRCP